MCVELIVHKLVITPTEISPRVLICLKIGNVKNFSLVYA